MKVRDVNSEIDPQRTTKTYKTGRWRTARGTSLNPTLHPDGGMGDHNFVCMKREKNDV